MNSPINGQAQVASRLANETVARAVRQWMNRLLQMDRRNSLLYFNAAKRGVPLADVEPDRLLEMLTSSRSGLAFTYAEKLASRRRDLFDRSSDEEAAAEADGPRIVVRPGDIESTLQPLELQKRLAGLAKRNREWVEEQGLSVLYVAIGTLNWLDEDQVPASSPVLLVPCELSRQSPRDPFYLVAEDSDDVSLNATLRHKLTLACGIELPEVSDGSVEDYLDSVRRLIAGREGCSVESTVVVATFPFSKLAMWEDLNRMSEPGAARHPLVRRLGGDGSAPAAEITPDAPMVPADDAELTGARLDDLLNVRDQYAVVDADFSQLRAIEMVRSGRNLVIHGPPGTGKSQTIANIIATLLAARKRVLFVSEKKAALDVVKKRLNDVGLGSFCLDLHSDRAKKASVYAQLRDFGLADTQPVASFPFDRLIARRDELNALVRELHRVRDPVGSSVFQVHARLAEIGDRPRLDIESNGGSALTPERLREIEDAVGRIKLRPVQFREHHTSHWRVLQELDPSPRMPDILQGVLTRLKLAIDQVGAVQNDVDAAYGFGGVESIGRARSQVLLLTHLAHDPGQVCEAWLQREGRARAVGVLEYLSGCIRERARLQAILAAKHSCPESLIGCAKRLAELGEVAKSGQRFERALGSEWDREALRDTGAAIANATLASDAFRSLAEAHAALCGTLYRSAGGSTRRECDDAVAFARELLAIGPIPHAWLTREAVAAIQVLVGNARELADTLASAEAALEKDFGLELIDLVDREMLVRYRTDHRSVFGWMHKAYWRDRKTLRSCMRQPRRLSLAFAQETVALALRTRSLRDRWEAGRVRLSVALEHLYQDRGTDWGRVLALLTRVLDLYGKKPGLQGGAATVLISAELLAAADVRSTRAGELRAALTPVWPERESTVNQSFTDAGEDAAAFAAAVTTIRDVCETTGKLLQASPTLRDWAALFETGSQLEALEADVAARTSTTAAYIGTRFRGWETAIVEVKAAIDWTATLNSLTETPIPQLICEMVMGARTYPDLAGQRNRHAGALAAFDASWQSAASYLRGECLPWPTWYEALVSIASKWCDELIADSGAANDWLDYCAAVRRLDTALAIGCTAAVRNATEDAAHVPGIVLRHVFLVWLDGVYATSRSLQIAPRDLAAVTQEFRELDRKLPVSARDRVRSQCTGALSGLSANQSFGEMGVLNHQLALRRKRLPVRKLVERIPNLLPTIKPCFMMSPLAVSQYLPRGNGDGDTLSFDVAIFDEASQVFPEDAVPSIARARQCVVVGDQQQLPPTSFFRSEEEEGDDEDEPEESGNRLENVESILDALVGMRGAGVSDVYLQVHYRSQHDNLIRYSNHYFYEDRLLTFPSAHGSQPGHGVRSVYLPEGRFEAGGSRTNRKEAERVVELAYELMASQPANQSIGVVALSRAQADLIQQLIDQRRLNDRKFDERFADEARERFFVKNLENVQGDERDHILLSIGYGPTTGSQVVPNRFGPLNAEGGHRRLNVAVSRARKSMTVVHSLSAEDIHSETKGALLLRRYLEYARNGEAAIEGEVSAFAGGEAESPFEEAVGRALEERGLRIARQVGCAKYRIDLAVRSDDGDGYDLAVECDGATYHRSPSARDRDRIRQEVLERLGWMGRIHRVWSTAWIRNPQAECDAIIRALESARARPRGERSTERSESAPPGEVPTPRVSDGAEVLRVTPRATVTESSTLFPRYELASLRQFRTRSDLRDESPDIIADLASCVVQCEEPVHIDSVVERVRRHYDLQRAGIHVRTAVESGIERAIRFGRVERLPRLDGKPGVSDFLGSPEKAARPRSADANGVIRPIERVSDQELAAGVLQVVRGLIGAPRDDVIVATARAFGYARTGGIVDSRLGQVIGVLLRSGALVERLGSLVAAVSDQA